MTTMDGASGRPRAEVVIDLDAVWRSVGILAHADDPGHFEQQVRI